MPPPDRWECYSPIGKPIPGTPFIALKVPLKEELMRNIFEKDKFSPTILIETLKQQGHKLGGIIDLTFTWKYYNREEFEKNSIKHWKIFTKGHDVPSENVFQNFAKAVKSVEESGSLIGVHCTHGVNRTGYLICRYMIEELNMEPDDAIALFNEARGHKLERENYLQDLKQRIKGKSTYDPDYVNTDNTDNLPLEHRSKERWRNNRADHPNWRRPEQEFRNSHYHPTEYWRTNETDNYRDEPVYNEYERRERYDFSSQTQRRNSSKPYNRGIDQNMSRKWTNDRSYRPGHNYHNDEFHRKRRDERYTHSSWVEEDSDKHSAYNSKYHDSESRGFRSNRSKEKTEGELMKKGGSDNAKPQHQYSYHSDHRATRHKRKLEDDTLDNEHKEHNHEISDVSERKKLKKKLEEEVTGGCDQVSDCKSTDTKLDLEYQVLHCENSETNLEG